MLDSPRYPSTVQKAKDWISVLIIPLVLVPMMAWALLSIIQTQKEIVALRADIKEVKVMMQSHLEASIAERVTNSMLHHLGPAHPCNNCHNPSGVLRSPGASPNGKTGRSE